MFCLLVMFYWHSVSKLMCKCQEGCWPFALQDQSCIQSLIRAVICHDNVSYLEMWSVQGMLIAGLFSIQLQLFFHFSPTVSALSWTWTVCIIIVSYIESFSTDWAGVSSRRLSKQKKSMYKFTFEFPQGKKDICCCKYYVSNIWWRVVYFSLSQMSFNPQ